MATTDNVLGLNHRSREHLIAQLVRLFERADLFELSLHDLFDEAEERFLEEADPDSRLFREK